MSYESLYEETEATRTAVTEARNDSWDTLEEHYKAPDPIPLVSDNINKLLDTDSEYMQQAREDSAATFEQAGMLESEFWTSSGEVAAIDNVLGVAEGDSQVDLYNKFISNQQDIISYSSAYDSHLEGLETQNDMLDAQHRANLEMEYQEEDFGYALESQAEAHQDVLELQDKEHQYDLAYQDYMQGYSLEQDDVLFNYHLEMKKAMNGFNTELRDQHFGYVLDKMDLEYQKDLDSQYRRQAYEQHAYTKDVSLYETLKYQQNYQEIVSSGMEATAKEDAVWQLFNQYKNRQNDLGTWKQVGDNPYRYEDFIREMATPAERGSDIYKTGSWFGGGVTLNSMGDFIDMMDEAFRDELGTKERHQYKPARQIAQIKEYWPSFLTDYPDEAEGMKRWFTEVIRIDWLGRDEQAYVDVVDHFYNAMVYLTLPEGKVYQTFGSPNDDGVTVPNNYKDYVLNDDGNIVYELYKPVAHYCEGNATSGCGTTPHTQRQPPTYYDYEKVTSIEMVREN